MLHFDIEQKHFVLINTLVGYGDVLYCPICKKIFEYTKASRLEKHKAKHVMPEKVLTFKQKQIQPMICYFEQEFKKPLIRNLYFGFDFEAILVPNEQVLKLNDNQVATQQLINIHKPIAFVLQCNNSKYPTIQYCGQDAAKVFIENLDNIHDTLVQELKNEFHISYKEDIKKLQKKYCKCVFISNVT